MDEEMAEVLRSAREFMSVCNMTDDVMNMVENKAPLKVGVDMDNLEVMIGVHDKMFFMDIELAEATSYAWYLACQTVRAAAAARKN